MFATAVLRNLRISTRSWAMEAQSLETLSHMLDYEELDTAYQEVLHGEEPIC